MGATVFDAGVTEDYDQFSQEFRLTSPADQTVSWIGGVYFQNYGLDEHDYLHVPTTSLVMPVLTSAFLQQGLCNSLATCSGLAGAFSECGEPARLQPGQHGVFGVRAGHLAHQRFLEAGVRWPLHGRRQGRLAGHAP